MNFQRNVRSAIGNTTQAEKSPGYRAQYNPKSKLGAVPTSGKAFHNIRVFPFIVGAGVTHFLFALILGGLVVELGYNQNGWILTVSESIFGIVRFLVVPLIYWFLPADPESEGNDVLQRERRQHISNIVFLVAGAFAFIMSFISMVVYITTVDVYSEQFIGVCMSLFCFLWIPSSCFYVYSNNKQTGNDDGPVYENMSRNGDQLMQNPYQ